MFTTNCSGGGVLRSPRCGSVKYEMLRRVGKDGHSISRAASAFDSPVLRSIPGAAGLQESGCGSGPAKRGPKQAHKADAQILEFIWRRAHDDITTGPAALAEMVQEVWGNDSCRTHRTRAAANQKNGSEAPLPPGRDCGLIAPLRGALPQPCSGEARRTRQSLGYVLFIRQGARRGSAWRHVCKRAAQRPARTAAAAA